MTEDDERNEGGCEPIGSFKVSKDLTDPEDKKRAEESRKAIEEARKARADKA